MYCRCVGISKSNILKLMLVSAQMENPFYEEDDFIIPNAFPNLAVLTILYFSWFVGEFDAMFNKLSTDVEHLSADHVCKKRLGNHLLNHSQYKIRRFFKNGQTGHVQS